MVDSASFETVWVGQKRDIEDVGALLDESLCTAVVNAPRGYEANS